MGRGATTDDVFQKLDQLARFGIWTNALLLMFSKYLVCDCQEQSPVPTDFMVLAFKCFDEGLCTTFNQFTRISLQATSLCQANVMDTVYILYEGVKKRLQDLPSLGSNCSVVNSKK